LQPSSSQLQSIKAASKAAVAAVEAKNVELQREQGEMMKVSNLREKRLEVLAETNEALTIIASREIEEKLRGESNWVFDKLHHY
jgi:hypothetical protein